MRQPFHWVGLSLRVPICLVALLFAGAIFGDQVETVTGDRYVGRVLSLGKDTLVLQSEILGTLKLPRAQVASITFGSQSVTPTTNRMRLAPDTSTRPKVALKASQTTSTNSTLQFDAMVRQLGANSNVISKVQEQFLAGAGPEAQGKFNELVSGLLSGKLGVNELRAEAKHTLDQAKAAQKELGDDGGSSLDSYLSILEGFLKETEPSIEPTNSTARASSPKTSPAKTSEDE
jgi:hypothetical protein